MKSVGKIVICFFSLATLSSCGNVGQELESKLEMLRTKAESLDSIVNVEVAKVIELDSLINSETDKVKKLDSLINQSATAIDSIANSKGKIIEQILK